MVPNGWELSCIGDISKTTMGFAFKSKDFVKNGIPLIRMGNLYQNKLQLERSPIFLPSAFSNEYARFLLRAGDLVMSMTGTMGKRDYGFTVQIPKGTPDCLLNQRVMKFDARHNSNLEFLKYLLRSEYVLTRLYAFPGGTKQANLSAKQVSEIPVLLPPLPEQRKIATILSTWDKAISTTEKLIETSKQQKKSLMQQLLTGKKRLGVESGTYSFQKTRYGDIPQDWEYPSIREICSQYSQKNIDNKELPVLSCSKHLGFVDSLKYFKKKVYSDDTSGYKVIPLNFFGFPSNHIEEGSIGLQRVYDYGIVSPIYVVFQSDSKRVDNEYLFSVLKTEHYRQIFCAATNASVDRRGSLRWKEFSAIHVPLPSLEEQQKIAAVLKAADKEIEVLEAKLAHFKQEKKALMQQLLTGKRRVSLSS
ncbi:TPA: restriction endonuclease subunit S [Vibrio parahaemolyticus]|nr:restriction endonuclease subunit S [Vibrio parahaemolyticus]